MGQLWKAQQLYYSLKNKHVKVPHQSAKGKESINSSEILTGKEKKEK